MPRWIMRLLYCVRGKRRVRLFITTGPGVANLPTGETGDLTIEGIELGVWGGYHVLISASVLEHDVQLIGKTTEVPKERVIFRQVLA